MVRRPQPYFSDCQSAPRKRLGFGMLALSGQQPSQVEQAGGNFGVFWT
jgi:hypothetical protein